MLPLHGLPQTGVSVRAGVSRTATPCPKSITLTQRKQRPLSCTGLRAGDSGRGRGSARGLAFQADGRVWLMDGRGGGQERGSEGLDRLRL